MSNLRYVCLSDVHFGASNSMLTHLDARGEVEPSQPSRTLVALVDCLRKLREDLGGPPPQLVLNGDVLDLALSSTSAASMAFERFVERAFPASGPQLFAPEILFIPGNHDHHLWESARELLHADRVRACPIGEPLPDEQHHTQMFAPSSVQSTYMTALLQRRTKREGALVRTAYPAFGALSSDGNRCVLFHHGHYAEPLYYLVTSVIDLLFPKRKRPEALSDFEAENFSWIDFFWGTLGRSGDAGKRVGLIYDKLQDSDATTKLVRDGLANLAARDGHVGLWERVGLHAVDGLIGPVIEHVTSAGRNASSQPFSDEARASLTKLIAGPLLAEVKHELGRVPREVTLVYGHTHKPFEGQVEIAGMESPVRLFNSGGWVVDSPDPSPAEGGAMILIDDNLDVASLRLYNEENRPSDYQVRVEAGPRGAVAGSLAERVAALIDYARDPWWAFSQIAAECVDERQQVLRNAIAQP